MAEYIEREALEARLNERYDYLLKKDGPYDHYTDYTDGYEEAVITVEDFPAADVAPVVHAYWAPCFDDDHRWREGWAQCSNCGRERYACTIRNVNYCPDCGARMDGGDEESAAD